MLQFGRLSKLAQLQRIIDWGRVGLWTKPQLLSNFCNFLKIIAILKPFGSLFVRFYQPFETTKRLKLKTQLKIL